MPPKPPHAVSHYEPVGARHADAVHTQNPRSRQELLSGARHVTVEDPEDTYLNSEESSAFLKRVFNLNRGPRRLAQLRAEGCGPVYYRDGNVVRYRPHDLREYAHRCLGEPLHSTSEESARRQTPEPIAS